MDVIYKGQSKAKPSNIFAAPRKAGLKWEWGEWSRANQAVITFVIYFENIVINAGNCVAVRVIDSPA